MHMAAETTNPTGACPASFRAACRSAAGGGYEWAGHTLIGAAHGLIEYRDDAEKAAKMEELSALICRPGSNGLVRSVYAFLDSDDAPAVVAWFERELPRCMELVPARRRRNFLRGVHRYVIEE